jgi:S-adenosylmethionine/arginine decarboxylase-like enzyme
LSQFFPNSNELFGWELLLDLYECDPQKVRSAEALSSFVIQLCKLIGVNAFGKPICERFGVIPKVKGYTIIQMLDCSTLVVHCSELKNAVYLEIFSCKPYDPATVTDFCRIYFNAATVEQRFLERK